MGAHYFDIEDQGFVMDRDVLNFTFRFALPHLCQFTGSGGRNGGHENSPR